jgi:hypothetical protein
MEQSQPKRNVLRFHVNYEREEAAILKEFFAVQKLDTGKRSFPLHGS